MPSRISIGDWRLPLSHIDQAGLILPQRIGPPSPSYDQCVAWGASAVTASGLGSRLASAAAECSREDERELDAIFCRYAGLMTGRCTFSRRISARRAATLAATSSAMASSLARAAAADSGLRAGGFKADSRGAAVSFRA